MSQENKQSEDYTIHPDVDRETSEALSDEDIIGRYMGGSGDSERIPIVKSWLPGGDEWQGKTIITKREAVAHALAKNLSQAFPEIRPMEEFIESSVNDLEMLLTSVGGRGREQQMEVLRAMFGAGKLDAEEAQSMAYTALAGQMEDENGD